MKILLIEPYYTGSHASWAEGFKRHSRHDVEILRLTGANWKWRMHGGAVTLARRFREAGLHPDLILATDMLDVTTFQSLTRRETSHVPYALYFHENQLSYPWSPTDRDVINRRDRHYGFINYASALACDAVFFNSRYHMDSFFAELVRLLKHFPDHNEPGSVDTLRQRSRVLSLGMDLRRFDDHIGADTPPAGTEPILLWNHRWEYDKNPEEFFDALFRLAEEGVQFRLVVLGENFSQEPEVFDRARVRLGERVLQFGFAESFEAYAGWLHAADVLPVTSHQDFFGGSVVEAAYCRCRPLLPRRLAYPELIPAALHERVFYDEGNFADRLRDLLTTSATMVPGLKEAAGRYDWTQMAPAYDDTFESMADSS